MTLLDWGIIAVVLFSVLLAISQGFFYEIFSLAGAVIGYLCAAWGYPRISGFFRPYVNASQYADIAAFLTIFFAVLVFAGIVGRLARWAMKEVGLSWIDRFLGGAFGLLRGVAIVTVGVLAIAAFAPDSQVLARSSMGGYFLLAAQTASWVAPYEVRSRVRAGEAAIRNLQLDSDLRSITEKKTAASPSVSK